MQTNFSINVNVRIGVTSELAQLVIALLSNRPAANAPVIAAPEPQDPPAASEEQPKPKRGRKAKADDVPAEATPTETEQPTDEAPAAAEAAQPKDQATGGPLTEEDIRAAMHKTRQRIEGEDYKENTDGEGYKKYHKQLTAQFKNIAAVLGSDKPSGLPVEQRASFIAMCDELIIGEDGNVTSTKAPF